MDSAAGGTHQVDDLTLGFPAMARGKGPLYRKNCRAYLQYVK